MSKELEYCIDTQIYEDCIALLDKECYANKTYYNIMIKWMKNRNQDKYVGDYLTRRGMSTVGVYGAGNLGELLVEELLKDSKIQVKYIIDRNAAKEHIENTPILKLDEVNEGDIDCMIITPIHAYESIKGAIENIDIFNRSSVIGIDKIIFDIADDV